MKLKLPNFNFPKDHGMVLDEDSGMYVCVYCPSISVKPKKHTCPGLKKPWLSIKMFKAFELYTKYFYFTF